VDLATAKFLSFQKFYRSYVSEGLIQKEAEIISISSLIILLACEGFEIPTKRGQQKTITNIDFSKLLQN
jgi:hypothetical protein